MKFSMSVKILVPLVCFVVLTPLAANAFYRAGPPAAGETTEPTHIIVKLKPAVDIKASADKRYSAVIGVPAYDALSGRYRVSEQELLFPRKNDAGAVILKNIMRLKVPDGVSVEEMAAGYRGLDEVLYAHPDWQAELYELPDDALYPHQWALNNTGQGCYHVLRRDGNLNDSVIIAYGTPDADIDAHEVYQNPPDNTRTVVVAISDTGVDMDHPELAGKIWTNPLEIPGNGLDDDHNGYVDDYHGWDFCSASYPWPIQGDSDPTDEHGHGTHCAGIIAARFGNGSGVAGILDNCLIMPLKFSPVMLSSFGAQTIVYAADNGADVVNMSWGYPWKVDVIQDALLYAESKGVILCAAAGNDGIEIENCPAACEGVVTVGATDRDDRVTSFSTFGDFVDICAPGYGILSLRANNTDMYGPSEADVHIIDTYYYLASGTSMACPHVTAAVAYMRAVSPGLIPDTARAILHRTADDYVDPYGDGGNYPGYDIYSGWGRLNLRHALDEVPLRRALITGPLINEILTGTLDITGVADGADFGSYVLEYGAGDEPESWTEINSSSAPVTDDVLGTWNTSGLSGLYSLRLRVDETNADMVRVFVGNETVAEILAPLDDDTVNTLVTIVGSAYCDDFNRYRLLYGEGAIPSEWDLLYESGELKDNEEMTKWILDGFPAGWYTLRLEVYSSVGLQESFDVQVYLVPPFDYPGGWRTPHSALITQYPNYGDFDNDGAEEIVIGTETELLFYDTDGTRKTNGVPSLSGADFTVPVAVGDLDGDGLDDFVAVGGQTLYGYPSGEPSFAVPLPTAPDFSRYYTTSEFTYPWVCLRDMDSDGRDEIQYFPGWSTFSETAVYYVYDSDGALKLTTPENENGFYAFFTADLDSDGLDEMYVAQNKVYRMDTLGVFVDSFDLQMSETKPFHVYALSALDVDDDNKYELMVIGAFGCRSVDDKGDHLTFAFDENLDLEPGWPHYHQIDCSAIISDYPLFGDFNGDLDYEYFYAEFEMTYGQLVGWQADGSPYVSSAPSGILASTADPATLFSPVAADFDGDHLPDIAAVADLDGFRSVNYQRVVAWNHAGEVIDGFPRVFASEVDITPVSRTPVVGDMDNDGHIDLAVTSIHNELLFTNIDGVSFDDVAALYPHWRYNRRMNLIGPLRVCVDSDGDGFGDPDHPENACLDDNCPFDFNPGQEDFDGDGEGDVCDSDDDDDGIDDVSDNCPFMANYDQNDADNDGVGDVCDVCPGFDDLADVDADGIPDSCDNCPEIANPDQADNDLDGTGNACCCVGYVGNVNCSEEEEPDISDITRVIDFLYISKNILCCPLEADANGSGGDPDISDITRLIDYLYLSHDPLIPCP